MNRLSGSSALRVIERSENGETPKRRHSSFAASEEQWNAKMYAKPIRPTPLPLVTTSGEQDLLGLRAFNERED